MCNRNKCLDKTGTIHQYNWKTILFYEMIFDNVCNLKVTAVRNQQV